MSRDDPDDDLVSRAKTGDPSAWRELYVAHAGRLTVWLSTSRLAVAQDAEDIAADAWLTAARKISKFSGDSSAFAGWLFGIARHLAMNANRLSTRRASSPSGGGDEHTLILDLDEDLADSVVGQDLTRRLLAQLPPREAEVVACLDVVGLDIASTAKALGISAAAVRVARHRGLGRLRSLVSPDDTPKKAMSPDTLIHMS